MTTSYKPVKGRAWTTSVTGLVDAATTTRFKATPTLAAGDVMISKDFGTYVNLTTLPVETPAGSGQLKVDLTATETTADNISIRFKDQTTTAEWCDFGISFETKEQAIPNMHFPMRDTSGNPATGKTVTLQRVIDAGTFGAGTIGSVTEIGLGMYRVNLPLADLNALDCTTLYATATGCMPTLVTLTSAY